MKEEFSTKLERLGNYLKYLDNLKALSLEVTLSKNNFEQGMIKWKMRE